MFKQFEQTIQFVNERKRHAAMDENSLDRHFVDLLSLEAQILE